jgi:hypothetical protein
MNRYIFTVKHDNGVCRIAAWAFTIAGALQILYACEKRPERSIKKIAIES